MAPPPPLLPSSYAWHRSPSSSPSLTPTHYQRRALAGEVMWSARPAACRELYVHGTLALVTSVGAGALCDAVRGAWRRLRFEVPEVGQRVEGEMGMGLVVPGEEGVRTWVARTAVVEVGEGGGEGFEGGRERVGVLKVKLGAEQEQVFLLVRGEAGEIDGCVKHIQVLLSVDHQSTDGIGSRILLGRFLSLLASALDEPEAFVGVIKWEQSVENLSPPWIGMMNEEQVFSGEEYEQFAESNREFVFEKMPTNPGLPLLKQSRLSPQQKTHFITFSHHQTTALLLKLKTLAPKATITHLGHACTVLALLRSHPPPPPSDTLYSPCWLNGRRYLQSSETHPEPWRSYIPVCLSFAPLVFRGLGGCVLGVDATGEEVKRMVERVCAMATREYMGIRERPSVLPGSVAWMEEAGARMWRVKQQTNTGREIEVAPAKSQLTAEPFFLSDGITEQYIDHSYYSTPGASNTSPKKKIFQVDDVKFAANAEKNLIVRMSSWRGQTTVSGEWVSSDFDNDIIIRFLEDVVGLILAILDDES